MKVTVERARMDHRSLLRILLAAIVGIGIVALAAGSTRPRIENVPIEEEWKSPEHGYLVLRDGDKSKFRVELNRKKSPDGSEPQKSRPKIENKHDWQYPLWYDGIWNDPRYISVLSRIV